MTGCEERIMAGLLSDGMPAAGRKTLEWLLSQGLLDLTACERRAICRRVEELVRQGERRTAAMEQTAETFCCSYEKVRAAVYRKG